MNISDIVGAVGLNTTPLGSQVSNVMSAGKSFASAKSAILRSAYPLMSAAFPNNAIEYEATVINSGASPIMTRSASGNGVSVMISGNGSQTVVYYSRDNIIWQIAAIGAGPWAGVAYGNGVFVAVAGGYQPAPGPVGTSSHLVATSPDGINWTVRANLPQSVVWCDVQFGGGLFVAVNGNGNTASNFCATSPDGITWTQRTMATSQGWYRVSYGNGLWIATANSAIINKSTDGINWTAQTVGANSYLKAAYGAGIWILITAGAVIETSPDGTTWTAGNCGLVSISDIAFGNGIFVAVNLSASAGACTSPDGMNWAQQSVPASSTGYHTIAHCLGTFIACYAAGAGNYASIWAEAGSSQYVYLSATAGTLVRIL